jgi:uncharacterized protein YjiS (DUF1127 family)
MQQMARSARKPQAIRFAPIPIKAPLRRVIGALSWLARMLFVQPIGRREDRLGALGDRILQDIGLKRADVHAAACGIVALGEAVPDYPGAGPLVACGRRGYPLALVRLSEAA